MTAAERDHYELHRPLPAVRLSRVDMQELLVTLTDPSVADGLLVHAGFHVRLDEGEVTADSPEAVAEEGLPPESSDVFLTVDFGERERYVRQVLVVFESHQAVVSISSNDEPWMHRVADLVDAFATERQAWFRHSGFLQRLLLVAGMSVVTLAAGIGNFGGADLRWVATWLFLVGVGVVAASAILPGQLRYSVVSLVSAERPGHSPREQAFLWGALALFSVTVVGAGIAILGAIAG